MVDRRIQSGSGGPTLCTPETARTIVRLLRAGNWITTACSIAGVTHSSYYTWMNRGREELERIEEGGAPDPKETPFRQFYVECTRARAEAEAESVARIRLAAQGRAKDADIERDWRADTWYLERSYPDRWGRRKVEVDQRIESTGTHEIRLDRMSDDALEELIEALEGQTEGDDGYEGDE